LVTIAEFEIKNTMTLTILNTSAYKFVSLDNLPEWRIRIKECASTHNLKGTVLLSSEGINIFLAGLPQSLNDFRLWLEDSMSLTDMPWKDSWSPEQPFKRLLVKLKKEIISMGMPQVIPELSRAKAVSPSELKAWLEDSQQDVVLVDTRNDYEVRLGTFDNALTLDLQTFRAFPEKVKSLQEACKGKKVVTFCTGGIRCEKAAIYMDSIGFDDVYQLDGGILKYFEKCQGDYYHGECFVFDRRVALDKELKETATVQCFACLNPVTPMEQRLDSYVPGVSCVFCVERKKPLATQTIQIDSSKRL
jgi:UPF0176 protein